jgi:hypothetical protein
VAPHQAQRQLAICVSREGGARRAAAQVIAHERRERRGAVRQRTVRQRTVRREGAELRQRIATALGGSRERGLPLLLALRNHGGEARGLC